MEEKFFLGHSLLGFHRTAYTEWGAGGRTTICVHGLTRNGRDFDLLAAELAKNRKVFCPDIAGRGKSDWLADASYYGYLQYAADMTALIARSGAETVDWVGTSMGGILGMMLAADDKTPIRKLVINDVGPFIPQAALKRIGGYVGQEVTFDNPDALEKYIRTIYVPFGKLTNENWRHLAQYSRRQLPDGRLTLAHDPTIAKPLQKIDKDVDMWAIWDRIRCPVLVLRGVRSDILSAEVAQEMTHRGPRAHVVEIQDAGHAPALMDPAQIGVVRDFLDSTAPRP